MTYGLGLTLIVLPSLARQQPGSAYRGKLTRQILSAIWRVPRLYEARFRPVIDVVAVPMEAL
ncbi:hypothetical protein GCM10010394_05170 [Streptomyces crystallinus]|uniref:Uncharacterized protein n=1 Tax=Streptomyces crystallinus TaxID=68191 RepID=A0ABN1F157_9ACTN